ncbi:J domain-containing protein [Sanyastnella coralliicola]|uniref:J domain-containing protein n=1 Tax=Sanyastnella coralliicola TaxID=3069118 RepID=UPI0027B9E9C1|nr:DnaJ domain-containing protein [Longitalea sp. SCSIO 12813]
MIDKYCSILGVEKTASLEEIKKAYRKKARQLHPDVNKSPDAHDQFILLNEAYEYLQNYKTGKTYNTKKHGYAKAGQRYKSYEEWKRNERERARRRAQEHARMQYEAFTKTEFYKTTEALDVLADFFNLLFVLFIFIGCPLIGYTYKGVGGLIAGIVMIFLTVHFWADVVYNNRPDFNLKELWASIVHLAEVKRIQLAVLLFINIVLLFIYGFNTLISLGALAALFALALTAGFIVGTQLNKSFHKRLILFGIAPGIINLVLLFNYHASSNETAETYSFKRKKELSEDGVENTTLIILEGNKYSEYMPMRFFLEEDSLRWHRKITYNIAEGPIGLRVVKSYEFD